MKSRQKNGLENDDYPQAVFAQSIDESVPILKKAWDVKGMEQFKHNEFLARISHSLLEFGIWTTKVRVFKDPL